jgi:hypothetical protein
MGHDCGHIQKLEEAKRRLEKKGNKEYDDASSRTKECNLLMR